MKKLNYKKKIKLWEFENFPKYILNNKSINLMDGNYTFSKPFEKISSKSNAYIKWSFYLAFKIIDNGITNKLINWPISNKNFLKKKHLCITKYIANKYSIKNKAILIYNNRKYVCLLTTNLPVTV